MRLRSIFILVIVWNSLCAQHAAHYSQYMFNGLLLNPAYAGGQEALNVTALYRNQWAGINGAPKVISFSAHSPLKNKRLNLGLSIENTSAGLFSQTQVKGMYAYRFPLGSGKLSFGLQAGADIKTFNRNNLRVQDNDDPTLSQQAMSTSALIAGAGVYYMHAKFYIGLAAPDLVSPDGTEHMTTQLHAGALLPISKDFKLKPAILLRHIAGSPVFANLSTTFYYKEIVGLGAGYTLGNAFLVYTDLRINEQINFGYAYERNQGQFGSYSRGSHEIMLRYLFRYRISAVNPRYF
jgi:type IX secretion system PorP/SprF family membrane protein